MTQMISSQALENFGAIRVDIVSDVAGLEKLRAQWASLAASRLDTSASQGPAYVEAALSHGLCVGELRILSAYQGAELVAVWPLYMSQSKGLRSLRHVGCGSREEYAAPLLAPHLPAEPLLAALWKVAATGVDLVEIYNLDPESDCHRFFASVPAQARSVSTEICPLILTGKAPWATWLSGKPRKFRDNLKARRKRLGSRGEIEFARVSSAKALDHARWCIETKRLWLDTHSIRDSWLRHDAAISFYGSLIDQGVGVEGFALALNGKPIAGCLCLINARSNEFWLTVYDSAFADCSPGNLLIEDVAAWCGERGLDFDFRFPMLPYKEHWADGERPVHTLILALTPKGARAVWRQKSLSRIRRVATAVNRGILQRRPAGGTAPKAVPTQSSAE